MVVTFWMMGKIASVLDEDEAAEASPFGKCESGTRTGLCRRIERFFCDLPIVQRSVYIPGRNRMVNPGWKNICDRKRDLTI